MLSLTIFSLIVLFFSIVIHEVAHGSVASVLGDDTAKRSGRLTLNPIKHIDPFGTLLLPLLLLLVSQGQGPIFGWAKPVPINSYNFRDKKWGILKVAIAGPLVNFSLALIFGLTIRFINLPESFFVYFSMITIYNFLWGVFNLLPIPPLDGSHILFSLLPRKWLALQNFLRQYGIVILLIFLFWGIGLISKIAYFLYYLVAGSRIIP